MEAKRTDDWMALHYAAGSGHETTARLLLDCDPDIDARKTDGWTALH